MALPRRSTAENKASELLDKHGIETLPIAVFEVIRALHVQVVSERMGPEVSGITYREGSTAVIGLNSAHHARRQRFTAAHEVGHIVLHPGRPLTIDSSIRVNFRDTVSSLATDAEEIEANAFAAALLMPQAMLVREVERLVADGVKSRDRLVAALARIFDVSPEAMSYRLINLGVASAP